MNYRTFRQAGLQNQCRECINGQYGLRLNRSDCIYLIYPTECSCCGQVRNIVADITLWGRCKILLRPVK